MTARQMSQQQIRLGFRITGTVTPGVAAVHTGVVRFSGTPTTAAIPTSRYPIANFCTITTTANEGTTMKFTRKGLWRVNAAFPTTPDITTLVRLQISLDATFLTPLINSSSAASGFLDYDQYQGSGAGTQGCLKVNAVACITNTTRGSGTYAVASPATTSPVGTVRLHASQEAGANPVASDLWIQGTGVDSPQLWCAQIAEIFG